MRGFRALLMSLVLGGLSSGLGPPSWVLAQPANDLCPGGLPIACGDVVFGDTADPAVTVDTPPTCVTTSGTGGGLWYTLTGTGDLVTLTTCYAGSNYDTKIRVYTGDCASLVCVTGNDDSACVLNGLRSRLEWQSVPGEVYRILVHGYATSEGLFEMSVSCTCSGPVTNLAAQADCSTSNVTLTWDPSGFDSYEIRRAGQQLASGLAAGTATYVDLGVPNGTFLYEVVGMCTSGGSASTSISTTMAAYSGEQDLVVRGELSAGLVDSVAALTAELTALGRTFVVHDGGYGSYPCNTAPFQIIWNMNGTFPNWRRYTLADGTALRAAQQAGAGIYTESGDQWGYAPVATDFALIDGIASASDGNDTFTAMDGFDSGFGLDTNDFQNIAYNQDSAGSDWTDQLVVSSADAEGPNSAPIWRLASALGTTYVTGVFYDTATGGNTISQTWEFGGFGGDKNDLASRYVAALGGTTQQGVTFVRGRCNGDAAVNLTDAIFLLGFLFPGASPPNVLHCLDACDANDDGAVNLTDVIRLLGALFGAVTVPLPAPNMATDCGPDPTDTDTLDCALPAGCP